MEKYRRWTDETAGINPFVVANTQTTPLIKKTIAFLIAFIKGLFFLGYLPLFVTLYLLPISVLKQKATSILLLLFGVYSKQDYSLDKADKNREFSILLSNHTCFIDTIYFLYKYPGCYFLGFSEDSKGGLGYFLISPLKMFFSTLTNLQPTYKLQGHSFQSLKELYAHQKHLSNSKLIIYYEKIRTNGKGTIKIEKNLCQQLYQLQKDLVISQLKYTSRNDDLFSLTSSSFSVIFASLSFIITGNNMKIRAQRVNNKDTHSANQLRQSVNSMAVGALLETKPSSYFEFIQFYKKTQKQAYKLE